MIIQCFLKLLFIHDLYITLDSQLFLVHSSYMLFVYHFSRQELVFTATVLQLHGLLMSFKVHKSVIRRKQC